MSLPWRFASVDDYVDNTIIKLQSGSPAFKALNIGRFYLNGSDLESHHIVLLLQHAKDNAYLDEISIHGITFDEHTASALLSLVGTRPRKWSKISFHFCHGEGFRILSAPVLIEWIRIKNCSMGIQDYKALGLNLQLNNMLTKLELFEEDLRGPEIGQALEDGLAITLSLQTLEFSYCVLDEGAVQSLAKGLSMNQSLTTFQCPGCELEDAEMAVLANSLSTHPELRHLKIFRNHCGEQGASAIASMLAIEQRTNHQQHHQLESLDLSYQQFERAKRLDIGLLASSLAGNTKLKEFSLSFNKLNDDDVELLAVGLRDNQFLTKLDLRANNIRDKGAIAIAEHLLPRSAIRQLYLFGNPFRKEGSESLLKAIQNNFVMEVLNMDYNSSMYDSIQFYTYLNQAGRRILHLDSFNVALWPLVLERGKSISERSHAICTHADIIFHLLQVPALQR